MRRSIFIDDFFEKKIRTDKPVLDLARKIKVIPDKVEPIFTRGKESTVVPVIVNITMKSGKVYSRTVKTLLGTPDNPVGIEIIADKFRKCAKFSAKPFTNDRIEEIISTVNDLEKLKDITQLTRLLVA